MKKIHAHLKELCQLIRHDIITSTTEAGSGHPTTSLSATELMTTLFFGGFLKYDHEKPESLLNDRVIFSKGHASPLLYALYHAAGMISYEKLMTLRKFGSEIEGHPTPDLKYVDVATGSLGQGLSVGLGMALGLKLRFENRAQKLTRMRSEAGKPSQLIEPKVWVLLGDSEFAEGQVWEALQLANHYKLNNLIGILDVNRLGQRGETMLGWDIKTYEKRIKSFGWNTIVVKDGHDLEKVHKAFELACGQSKSVKSVKSVNTDSTEYRFNRLKPCMIIAKTMKGKGISFLENKDNWHGKAVPKDRLEEALKEIGLVDIKLRGKISKPSKNSVIARGSSPKQSRDGSSNITGIATLTSFARNDKPIATRAAYGEALVALGQNPNIVVLDAETSNSTYAEKFKNVYPERFFEMYIAEQNMASAALGFAKIGFIPYISSFAAFLTRTFDQIRIAQYSNPNLKVVGSHAGISIGQDGSSQMGLEDISMMQSILKSVVLYPSDAISTFKLAEEITNRQGIFYLRLTRAETPILYNANEKFTVGGSKVLKSSSSDKAVVVAAGITLFEALKAYDKLKEKGTKITVIDAYSVKPIDKDTIVKYAKKTGHVIVVEDHYPIGGLGSAVKDALAGLKVKITHLAVNKIPHSGKPEELLKFEEIDSDAIINTVKGNRKKKEIHFINPNVKIPMSSQAQSSKS